MARAKQASLPPLGALTIAYVGDSANVLHNMLVTYPRLGHNMRVASPPQYRAPAPVTARLEQLGIADQIAWTADPAEAVKDADVVVTDVRSLYTYHYTVADHARRISMGQEAEKAERLRVFPGVAGGRGIVQGR